MMVNDDDDNASCLYLQAIGYSTVSTVPTLSYLGYLIRHLPSSSQHVCS